MTAAELVEAVHQAGGVLTLDGDRIRYNVPKTASWIVTELRRQKDGVVAMLRKMSEPPEMPQGVRLVEWKLKVPPIAILRMGIVTDVKKFADATILQLKARLEGKDFLAGNWHLRELVERLEQVGVKVAIETVDVRKNSHE